MKSLKYYIKLVEATNQQADHWIANLSIDYEFPDNPLIPQRTKQIESIINSIMEKHDFYETGSGGGFGARDISYAYEGSDLSQILSVARQAQAEIEKFITQIKNTNAKLGIAGMEMSVAGWITDSDYEYHLDFDEAEQIIKQSQQAGKK